MKYILFLLLFLYSSVHAQGYGYYGPDPWYHRPADPPGQFGPRYYNVYPPPDGVPYYEEMYHRKYYSSFRSRYRESHYRKRSRHTEQNFGCALTDRGFSSCFFSFSNSRRY